MTEWEREERFRRIVLSLLVVLAKWVIWPREKHACAEASRAVAEAERYLDET
jgi:hypothetical protein